MSKVRVFKRNADVVLSDVVFKRGLSLQALGLYASIVHICTDGGGKTISTPVMAETHGITTGELLYLYGELISVGLMVCDNVDSNAATDYILIADREEMGCLSRTIAKPAKKTSDAKRMRAEQIAVILAEIKDELLAEKYAQLFEAKKWRTKQPSTLALTVKKGMAYAPAFQMECIDTCLQGEYQGLYFPDTPEKYKKWLQNNQQNGSTETNKTNYPTF